MQASREKSYNFGADTIAAVKATRAFLDFRNGNEPPLEPRVALTTELGRSMSRLMTDVELATTPLLEDATPMLRRHAMEGTEQWTKAYCTREALKREGSGFIGYGDSAAVMEGSMRVAPRDRLFQPAPSATLAQRPAWMDHGGLTEWKSEKAIYKMTLAEKQKISHAQHLHNQAVARLFAPGWSNKTC